MKTQPSLRKVLYASYQTGESLPGYVRYALEGLCQTGFSVVYLTNERDLDASSHAFLDSHHIELFFTVNRGYDFGMWSRYIAYTAKFRREEWERLVLVNDSVIYFQNRFVNIFNAAEDSPADVVSLTSNNEQSPHLQSYFLYMKSGAIQAFCERLLNEPEGKNFYDTVTRFEVGTSVALREKGLVLDSLVHTENPVLFSYPELIEKKFGFVKRKFLQKRWTRGEAYFFWDHHAGKALLLDYTRWIREKGSPDRDFNLEWLNDPKRTFSRRIAETFRFAYYKFRWWLSHAKAKRGK
ncbi:MAG: hypothetical protein J6Z31_01750 [Fibrobacter sp.]|nr:hypothetical protein [Fibrobacter sp.]